MAAAASLDALLAASAKYHAPVLSAHAMRFIAANATRPVVLMHGLGDAASNAGMQSLVTSVETAYPGKYAMAAPVADGLFSFIERIQTQVDAFAAVVRGDPNLVNGFDAVGLSQGGVIVRGYIEQYNNPPVFNFVSICGIQGGEYDCPLELQIIPFVCDIFKSDPYRFLFNGSIPLSFSDYWVQVANRSEYLSQNTFLPYVNNEVMSNNSAVYKQRFSSLTQLALIAALQDTVVYPWQAEQFGGYVWGSNNVVFNYTQSPQYTQDLIGFRTLWDSGRVTLSEFEGDHLRFNDTYWNDVVLPFFNN